jgi:hypothetical protein
MQPSAGKPNGIKEGDRVRLRRDGPGTVLAVIREGPSKSIPSADPWRRLGRGIVVRLDSGALVHIREPSFELVPVDDALDPNR